MNMPGSILLSLFKIIIYDIRKHILCRNAFLNGNMTIFIFHEVENLIIDLRKFEDFLLVISQLVNDNLGY